MKGQKVNGAQLEKRWQFSEETPGRLASATGCTSYAFYTNTGNWLGGIFPRVQQAGFGFQDLFCIKLELEKNLANQYLGKKNT